MGIRIIFGVGFMENQGILDIRLDLKLSLRLGIR